MSERKDPKQTLSQRRAAFALREVKAVAGRKFKGEFRSYAAGLPPMIQMSGFGQALAFCRSKSKDDESGGGAYKALYDIVSRWLTGKDQPYEGFEEALDGVVEESMNVYRLAESEALALLDWVKRFASACIQAPKDASDAAPAGGEGSGAGSS